MANQSLLDKLISFDLLCLMLLMRVIVIFNCASNKREAKPISEDSHPPRFESFLLGNGEKKEMLN